MYLAATRLHRALAKRALTRTDFRVPRYATLDLAGRTVDGVTSRGKHTLFHIEGDVVLHTHFMMEGSWDLYRRGEKWQGPGWQVRAVLETEPWVAVGFRLPVIDVLEKGEEDRVVGHLGPDPLRDWDEEEALRRLEARSEDSIGEALLDQSVIAGLGNVYKSEICFLRGLHPLTSVDSIEDLRAVVVLAKRLLEANRATGNQITTGDARRGRTRWVYGREGRACRRCHTAIEKLQQAAQGFERVTYLCPSCQPAGAKGTTER